MLLGAVPAAGLGLVAWRSGTVGAEALFRGDAAGLSLAVAVAAFSPRGTRAALVRMALVSLLLAAAHAAAAAALSRSVGGAPALALLSLAVMAGTEGLGSLGRAFGVPDPAAGAIGAAVLWLACGGLWWADAFAERFAQERRPAVRQAVLDLDPFTAAAYDAAGLDRLHLPEVYEGTTIATVAVARPTAVETSAWWGGLGLVLGAAAAGVRRLRRPAAASSG